MLSKTPLLKTTSPNDLISHVPPKFCRAGHHVYIDEKGFTCHPGSEVARLTGYVFRAMRLRWLAGKPHSMVRYDGMVSRGLDKLDR